ncbi:MAG: hypothetical protein ACLSA6_04460 [Holdemania massiliensis]
MLGFSMGGVIAAFLASFLAVDKLVLVAPAFEYMSLETVSRLIPQIRCDPQAKRIAV